MPDDRLIHRRLGHSEKVGKLTDFERGVWLACLLAADDFGVLRFSAVTMQDSAGWLEHKSQRVVRRALETVASVGLLRTFQHQDRTYCIHPDWQDWQKIEYPRATNQPKPLEETLALCSVATQRLFDKHPGGFRKKSCGPENFGTPSGHLRDTFGASSEHLRDTVGTPSAEITHKPLAVSRKPIAAVKKEISSEPKAAREPADDSPTVLTFPVTGAGGHSWRLTEQLVTELEALFPGMDVRAECRKALAWIHGQPERRKTARGMRKFLTAWLTRAVDRPSGHTPMASTKTAGNFAALQRFATRGQG